MNDSQSTGPSDELLADLRLSLVSGIGPRLRQALLSHFGTAGAVFAAAPSDLRDVPGIGAELTRRLAAAPDEIDARAQWDLCRTNGICLLTDASAGYPRMLREICDPPGIFFVRGTIQPQDALAIAIVGSRHATQYGLARPSVWPPAWRGPD